MLPGLRFARRCDCSLPRKQTRARLCRPAASAATRQRAEGHRPSQKKRVLAGGQPRCEKGGPWLWGHLYALTAMQAQQQTATVERSWRLAVQRKSAQPTRMVGFRRAGEPGDGSRCLVGATRAACWDTMMLQFGRLLPLGAARPVSPVVCRASASIQAGSSPKLDAFKGSRREPPPG